MTINTKRLETDAAYWGECGAIKDATHFNSENHLFYKVEGPYAYVQDCKSRWVGSAHQGLSIIDYPVFIPRPTKPAASDWADGLPPVGCECEYRPDPKIHDGWHRCIYLAHYGREHFVLVSETGEVDRMLDTLSPGFRFRPLRTAEQRQREELANEVSKAMHKVGYAPNLEDPESIADAILSRYNLEPKP